MLDPKEEFAGKVVAITGAAGIFGGWFARAFADAGALLSLSDIRMDALQRVAKDLQLDPERCVLHQTELRDDASLREFVEFTTENLGVADIVINNAGVYPIGFLLDFDNDAWDRVMDINLRAPFVLSREFGRAMIRAGKHGSIVNISSGAARSMRSTMVPYCVSKAALDRLTKGLAVEFAEFGVRVNVVEPGFMPGSEVSALTEENVRETAAKIPLGRTSGPNDAAGAVMYLCSSMASFITGATLSVDGGNSAGSRTVYQQKKQATV